MSGGSLNYTCYAIEELADNIYHQQSLPVQLFHLLNQQINLLSAAMHDIEWVDSGDYSLGEEEKAIKRFLGKGCDRYRQRAKLQKPSPIDIDSYLFEGDNRYFALADVLSNQDDLWRKAMSIKVRQFAEVVKNYQGQPPNFLSEFRIKEIENFLDIEDSE